MDRKIQVAFAAINERLIENIPENVAITGSSSYAYWGKSNRYPSFLYDTYKTCPTLQTIINGYVDYIVGDGVSSSVMSRPNGFQDWDEFITSIAVDYVLYGLAYIQVIRDKADRVSELHWIDARFIRMDEDNQTFFYNEDFAKKYVRTTKQLIYPKFDREFIFPASILMIKNPMSTREIYGVPIYESAMKSILTEIKIDDFHLSELDNNFTASAILNFNSGIPEDEEKDEIEKMVSRKFTGNENAGRFLLSFNNGKDNETTVQRLQTDDFDKRYESLADKTQKQIFTAFGVSPVVFGVFEEGKGFSDQDFVSAFKLFNRTRVKPSQKRIIDALDKVLGVKGSVTIKPFSIDFSEEGTEDKNDKIE